MDGADGVYPASEDTHLLIDALEADADLLRGVVKGHGLCLEVGYVRATRGIIKSGDVRRDRQID